MDRLTKRSDYDTGVVCDNCPKHGNCNIPSTCLNVLADRLAAYEDTDLMPMEIKSLWEEWQVNLKCLDKYRKAEAEGRLIVLPENWKDLCGRKGMQLYTIYEGDVYDAAITDVYIDENGKGRFAYAVFPSEDPFDSEWLDEPVSRFWDVLFRTYDEAEAACKIDETELLS